MLDGVYQRGTDGTPEFVEAPAPTDEALPAVLHRIITRTMKLLTRRGLLVEEEGSTYMADNDGDSDKARSLRPLQAAPGRSLAMAVHWTANVPLTPAPRQALANERVQTNAAGQMVLKLKTAWRDGTTHLVMSPLAFMQRLAVLVPRPRLHLIRLVSA